MPLDHQITYLQAVLLGLLQGLTEFLPVSSTAHMAIAPQLLFGMPDPGASFSAVVQLGPIVAIIAYFRHDLKRYLDGIIRTKSPANVAADDVDARLGWYTLLGTIPMVIFGLLLESKIDKEFRQLQVMAIGLIALAIVLAIAEYVGKRKKSLEQMSFKESQAIGWAQVLCLVPGTSRSGVTITAALFCGLEREAAARFSFLLSIPAITGAGVYKLAKVLHKSQFSGETGPYLVGTIVAGAFAYVVIKWFLGFMKEHNTSVFIVYRIVLGAVILALLHTGRIHDVPKEPEAPTSTNLSVTSLPAQDYVATPDGHFVPVSLKR
ncbi:MAG TPA: undecaprenyl-diphosphatase UppP [Capsulimonadaceae bacterium]|jgi:undecaprenyl-diphosphatase